MNNLNTKLKRPANMVENPKLFVKNGDFSRYDYKICPLPHKQQFHVAV